jgi:hypothetical protein
MGDTVSSMQNDIDEYHELCKLHRIESIEDRIDLKHMKDVKDYDKVVRINRSMRAKFAELGPGLLRTIELYTELVKDEEYLYGILIGDPDDE